MRSILFTLYIQPQSEVISQSRCGHYKFADDTQLHTPSDFHSLIVDIEQCADSFGRWVTGNRLKQNNDKTEALLVGSRRRVCVSQDNHLSWQSCMMFPSKAILKISGSTLTLLYLW